jgi:nucleoside-diphosphate-sugar epimerase
MQLASASSRRVLVTGGDGFTGRHLLPELVRRGYTIVRHSVDDCDLRKAQEMRQFLESARPDYVIHLAAITFVPHGSPAEIYEVNSVGTSNLLDAIAAASPDVGKVILASSSQVYGQLGGDELDETSPCRPINHYACSKLAMEHMAATYADRLPIIITRPFNYTGPGQPAHFLVPKIVEHYARRATTIELGNTEVVRDFSDVRMVTDAYCRLLESPCQTGTFNICSGVGRSLRWLIEETGRLAGHRIEVKVNAGFLRASDAARLVGSNRQLVGAIGPLQHSDLSETLRWMLQVAEVKPATAG